MMVKNITNRHMPIMNLFQPVTYKSNQPLQIAITKWRKKKSF